MWQAQILPQVKRVERPETAEAACQQESGEGKTGKGRTSEKPVKDGSTSTDDVDVGNLIEADGQC